MSFTPGTLNPPKHLSLDLKPEIVHPKLWALPYSYNLNLYTLKSRPYTLTYSSHKKNP